jgi:1-deoxy-D-xylulose-5-phosphate synthase
VAILSFGTRLAEVLALIDRLIDGHGALVTVEQGSTGGFGALVLHHLAQSGQLEKGRAIRTMTLPDRFIDQASPAQMYDWAGLTAGHIRDTARAVARPLRTARIVSLT